MDTSKDYYESVMRDFQMYGRGRTLEQYCRDEAVDYRWIEKAMSQYGVPEKTKAMKTQRKTKSKSPDMIQLHFEPEPENPTFPASAEDTATPELGTEVSDNGKGWRVASLKVITPAGHEIEILTSNPSAVSELLMKLTA